VIELHKRFNERIEFKDQHSNLLQRRKEFEGLNYMVKVQKLYQSQSWHI